jgi:hypothetical protein
LTGSGDNTLKLNLNDLLDISSETNTLKVIGDSGDKVEATGFNKLTAGGVANGVTYDVYINASASTAQLWVDQDLTVRLSFKVLSPEPVKSMISISCMRPLSI